MRKSICLIVMASVVLGGCTREFLVEESQHSEAGSDVLYASFESPGDGLSGTKTYLDENHKLLWTADDRLGVFLGNTYNQQYKFKGSTGATSGSFAKVPTDDLVTGNDIGTNYAVYPYNENIEISNSEVITLVLPSVQKYAVESFGPGANTMVAATNGTSDNFLSFKNLCGYLVIKLYGSDDVKQIVLEGNNGEKIAGTAKVIARYGENPSLEMTNTAITDIELDCGSGVSLGKTSSSATEFWFCVPPVTFSKGFSIKVQNVKGQWMTSSVNASKTIERNTFYSMSALKVSFPETPEKYVPEMVDLGLSVKWASFNLGATKPEEFGDYYAWGETEPYYQGSYSWESPHCNWKSGYEEYGYDWPNYKWSDDTGDVFFKYNTDPEYGTVDNKIFLDSCDDAAAVLLGDKWRMPTRKEFEELLENCTLEWTDDYNGTFASGIIVKSNKDGYKDNFIFLPQSWALTQLSKDFRDMWRETYYWTSSLLCSDATPGVPVAAGIRFIDHSSYLNTPYFGSNRCFGASVRPVYGDKQNSTISGVSLNNTNLELVTLDSYQLDATLTPSMAEGFVTWASSNVSIAVVDKTGKVYGVNPGKAVITAEASEGGYSASCNVTVLPFDGQSEYHLTGNNTINPDENIYCYFKEGMMTYDADSIYFSLVVDSNKGEWSPKSDGQLFQMCINSDGYLHTRGNAPRTGYEYLAEFYLWGDSPYLYYSDREWNLIEDPGTLVSAITAGRMWEENDIYHYDFAVDRKAFGITSEYFGCRISLLKDWGAIDYLTYNGSRDMGFQLLR